MPRSEAPSPAAELERFLREQDARSTLRFITCGSVDDGKSTLIGRLLYDSKLLFEDQLRALETDSRTTGSAEGGLDFALLVDGLQAEREQGITIDVAYRYFATPRRRFIVADTPGHEQYTRNMATGASTASVAVLIVDARRGVLTQTRRHSHIARLLGIRHVALAVNKMDLIDFDQRRFDEIVRDFGAIADRLAFGSLHCIPVSARHGDNVFDRSAKTPWYGGSTLMQYLEEVDVAGDAENRPFRLPVQWVNRPSQDFRGFCGRVASGAVRPGDAITVYPSGRSTTVDRIVTADGDLDRAVSGQSVTLTLAEEIDVSRGDVLAAGDPPLIADQFAAHMLWMDTEPMMPGRQYLMKCGSATTRASISALKHRIDVDTLFHEAATTLALNEIGVVTLSAESPVVCDPYEQSREGGGFILVDMFNNRTVGAGTVDFALYRATNVRWQKVAVDKDARATLKKQKPVALWFTGLSGAGKSTIADALERRLAELGHHTYLLDGDNLRHGLNRDLGFTPEARVENVRRVAEVAKLFVDAGLIVMAALISPFRSEREMARHLFEGGEFIEIYVSTPLEECERRDVKGLYKKARAGAIPTFTGISSPYEPPEHPEFTVDTTQVSPADSAEEIVGFLRRNGHL
jgi:bifunctional enzyme CysN/CysC